MATLNKNMAVAIAPEPARELHSKSNRPLVGGHGASVCSTALDAVARVQTRSFVA